MTVTSDWKRSGFVDILALVRKMDKQAESVVNAAPGGIEEYEEESEIVRLEKES